MPYANLVMSVFMLLGVVAAVCFAVAAYGVVRNMQLLRKENANLRERVAGYESGATSVLARGWTWDVEVLDVNEMIVHLESKCRVSPVTYEEAGRVTRHVLYVARTSDD